LVEVQCALAYALGSGGALMILFGVAMLFMQYGLFGKMAPRGRVIVAPRKVTVAGSLAFVLIILGFLFIVGGLFFRASCMH